MRRGMSRTICCLWFYFSFVNFCDALNDASSLLGMNEIFVRPVRERARALDLVRLSRVLIAKLYFLLFDKVMLFCFVVILSQYGA